MLIARATRITIYSRGFSVGAQFMDWNDIAATLVTEDGGLDVINNRRACLHVAKDMLPRCLSNLQSAAPEDHVLRQVTAPVTHED